MKKTPSLTSVPPITLSNETSLPHVDETKRPTAMLGNRATSIKEPIGNGSLYPVGEGRSKKWKYDFYYMMNGQKYRKTFNGKTRQEAIDKRNKFLEIPEYVEDNRILTVELIDIWLYQYVYEKHKSKGNVDSTFVRFESAVNNHMKARLLHTTVDQLTDDVVEKLLFAPLREQDEEGQYKYSVSMFNKVFHAMDDFCEWCILRNYLQYNPTRDITKMSTKANPPREIMYYSEEESKQLIKTCLMKGKDTKNVYGKKKEEFAYRYGLAHILQLETGTREGELLSLKWDNVNLDKKEITVRSTINISTTRNQENLKEYTIVYTEKKGTKTRAGCDRTIPLTDLAHKVILLQKELQIKEFGKQMEYVFTNTKGKKAYIGYYADSLEKVTRMAGLACQGTHVLRHTFATRLFAKEVPIKVISVLLGHSSTRVTEDIYIHVIEEQRKKAINQLNKNYDLNSKIFENIFDDTLIHS